MATIFTRKNNRFSHLCDRKLMQLYYLNRWLNLSRQIPQPIASRAAIDACQNNLASLFSRRSPRGSFEPKPCKKLPNSFAVLQFLRTRWTLRSLVQGLTCFASSACRINSRIMGKQQFFHTKFLYQMHHPRQAQSRAVKAKT